MRLGDAADGGDVYRPFTGEGQIVRIARVARAEPRCKGAQVGVETGAHQVRNNRTGAGSLWEVAIQGTYLRKYGGDVPVTSEPIISPADLID